MIRFRDRSAEEWLRTKTAGLLRRLKAPWQGQVQDTIVSGLEQGLNPSCVGLELTGRVNPETGKREGGSICLDQGDKLTVREFERCLVELDAKYLEYDLRDKRYDRSVRRAIDENKSLAEEKIALLVGRFEAKLLKHNADLIARTEMLAAMNCSEWLSTKRALESSDLPESALARIWDSCGDDDVRPSHKALDGQRIVGLSASFISPLTGARMMHPGDTTMGAPEEEIEGCRCRVRYELDFLAKYH